MKQIKTYSQFVNELKLSGFSSQIFILGYEKKLENDKLYDILNPSNSIECNTMLGSELNKLILSGKAAFELGPTIKKFINESNIIEAQFRDEFKGASKNFKYIVNSILKPANIEYKHSNIYSNVNFEIYFEIGDGWCYLVDRKKNKNSYISYDKENGDLELSYTPREYANVNTTKEFQNICNKIEKIIRNNKTKEVSESVTIETISFEDVKDEQRGHGTLEITFNPSSKEYSYVGKFENGKGDFRKPNEISGKWEGNDDLYNIRKSDILQKFKEAKLNESKKREDSYEVKLIKNFITKSTKSNILEMDYQEICKLANSIIKELKNNYDDLDGFDDDYQDLDFDSCVEFLLKVRDDGYKLEMFNFVF